MSDQAELFSDYAQPRKDWREAAATYRAVLMLRSRGWRVWRAGVRQHLVGDRLVTTKQLKWLARQG